MNFQLTDLTTQIQKGIRWVETLTDSIPSDLDFRQFIPFVAVFTVFSLILALIGRSVFGKRSGLNHAVSSAIGILFIYAISVVIYTFEVNALSSYLTPLPYVAFYEDRLFLFPFMNADFTQICTQLLSMVILAFLVNLLDTLIPKGKNVFTWYLLRFLTVALAMGAHFIVSKLLDALLPGIIVTYAPIILLVILAATLLLGLISLILGFVVSSINPVLGVLTTFFFRNMVGKQLSKAVLTTALLTVLFYLMEHFGYLIILIAPSALTAYIPFIFVLLVLWYVIGHIL